MSINVKVSYNGSDITTLSNQSSVPITYNGNTLATLTSAGTKNLNCNGQYMLTNVGVGSKTLNCAGKIMASNVVVTATNAAYYLIQGGALQHGYAITVAGKKPSSSSTLNESSPVMTNNSGNIQIEARGSGTYKGSGIAYISTKIDLTPYKTLHIVGTAKNGTGNVNYLNVQAWTSIGSYWSSNRIFSSNVSASSSSYVTLNHSVNVSSYTSSVYIGVAVARDNSQSSAFRIVDFYLE